MRNGPVGDNFSCSRSPSPLRTAWPTAPQHRIRSVAVLVPDRLHPAPAVDLAAEPQRSAAAQEAPEANGIAASHRKLDYARRDGSPATEPSRPSVITVHGESPANLRRMALQGMRKHIGKAEPPVTLPGWIVLLVQTQSILDMPLHCMYGFVLVVWSRCWHKMSAHP